MDSVELDRILADHFTSTFRKGHIVIKGTTLPLRYIEMKEEIDNLDVFEEDVWICSFPKSGTTWMQEMIWMIRHNLDFDGGKENLGSRSPFLELSAIFDYRDLMRSNTLFRPPIFLQDSIGFVKSLKGPQVIKTHLPWYLLPKQIQNGEKLPKIIYIARNPKDVCISYYHHCKLLEGFTGNFDQFSKLFLADKVSYAPYWQNVLSFWNKRHQTNVLFITYEELVENLPLAITKVAKFLKGSQLNIDDLQKLTHHLSFGTMKKNEAVNYDMVMKINKEFKIIMTEGEFIREGKVGQFEKNMPLELVQKLNAWIDKNKKGTDFNLY